MFPHGTGAVQAPPVWGNGSWCTLKKFLQEARNERRPPEELGLTQSRAWSSTKPECGLGQSGWKSGYLQAGLRNTGVMADSGPGCCGT